MEWAGDGDIRIHEGKEHRYPHGIPVDWAGDGDIRICGGGVVERLAEGDGQQARPGRVGGRGYGRRDRIGQGHRQLGRVYGVARHVPDGALIQPDHARDAQGRLLRGAEGGDYGAAGGRPG